MDSLQLQAAYYHSMGMNIAPIYGCESDPSSFKRPGIDINIWHKERQSFEDIMSFNWADATGIGLITGFNGIRAIDIDAIKDTKVLEEPYKNKIIGRILMQLNLPDNYQWVVKSGSGKGCHIIFQSDYLPDMKSDNFAFATMDSRSVLDYGITTADFKSMEISWNFFLVLPPSMHKDCKASYTFWYKGLPSTKPSHISNENLINMIDCWFGYDYKEEWFFDNNKFVIHYREFNTTYDSSRIKDAAEKEDFRGLLMICNEGRNTLAFKHDKYRLKLNIYLDLLKSSNCSHARLNLVNLMAVGYIKVNYNEFHKRLKDLVNDGIIEEWESEELEEKGRKSCKQPNRLMFFDTETNGLPPKYDPYLSSQPRIVQLSWVMADEDGNIEKRFGCLIKPVDFDIPEDSVKVHGITKEKAMRRGILIKDAISLFLADLNSCNALVGHNVSFDIQVLKGELERLNITNAIHEVPYYCTMRLSVDYCKIPTEAAYIRSSSHYLSYSLRHPREYKYKFPKLIELYEFLFDERFDNAHDANADVEATVKCFFELKKRKVINYKPTNKTYYDILTSKDGATNVLNHNILSLIERWKICRSDNKWLVKAILATDRIVRLPLLYNLSREGAILDTHSSEILYLYGLAQSESFYINRDAIAISKMNVARLLFKVDPFEISEITWESNNGTSKWRTKHVRSFSKDEQVAVNEAKVVASQFGKSVKFIMSSGRETFIPLSNNSSLNVNDCLYLNKAKLISLFRNGEDDIYRVIEE